MGSSKRVGQKYMSRSAALYTPVAVLLVLFIGIFAVSVFFRVTEFEIIGTSKYSVEEIKEASGISAGDYLLLIDYGGVDIRLRSKLPYISESRVYRRLPGTVCIEVTESSAIAAVSAQGSVWVIDSGGTILEKQTTVPAGLVTVLGIVPIEPTIGKKIEVEAGSETAREYMSVILKAINQMGIQKDIKRLDVTNISRITFTYRDIYTVTLGGADDVRYKLDLMLAYIETRLTEEDGGGSFDLSGEQLTFIRNQG